MLHIEEKLFLALFNQNYFLTLRSVLNIGIFNIL